jgi:uncharacterized protein
MIRFVSIFALLILVDLYVFQSIKTVAQGSKYKTIIYSVFWGYTLCTFLFFAASAILDFRHHGTPMSRFGFGVIMGVFVAKLIVVIFLLLEDFFRLGFHTIKSMI